MIVISTILIVTYAASRTIGVPIIGIEFYIGKYDILTKVLQGIIIAISGYLIYSIRTNNSRKQQQENKKLIWRMYIWNLGINTDSGSKIRVYYNHI